MCGALALGTFGMKALEQILMQVKSVVSFSTILLFDSRFVLGFLFGISPMPKVHHRKHLLATRSGSDDNEFPLLPIEIPPFK